MTHDTPLYARISLSPSAELFDPSFLGTVVVAIKAGSFGQGRVTFETRYAVPRLVQRIPVSQEMSTSIAALEPTSTCSGLPRGKAETVTASML